MCRSPAGNRQSIRADRLRFLGLDDFAWETVEQESARTGVTAEAFIAFAVLYYVADIDSGRIARRISSSTYGEIPERLV